MPCFQGVEVAIATLPDSKKLPEFPVLDPSSQHILPSVDDPLYSDGSGPASSDTVSPRIPVYIPSNPEARFAIQYTLNEPFKPSRYLYFKIFMNGRNIANCGMDPARLASGSITRSLCEPSDRWHYKEDGVLLRRDGIEARCFLFLSNPSQTSVADDGGFIEIQVFRAKGRRRRTPTLEKHRGQEAYGIGSPSGGLLDSPEEACFYDWILVDPKDLPFVSFQFHYRSWSNLRQLNLAPHSSESNGISAEVEGDDGSDETMASDGSCHSIISGNEVSESGPASHQYVSNAGVSDLDQPLPLQLKNHHKPPLRGLLDNAAGMSSPDAPHRPLPEIPVNMACPAKELESCSLPFTPSFLSDIEEAIEEELEEVEIGVTTTFPVRSSSLRSIKSRSPALNGSEHIMESPATLEEVTEFPIQEALVCSTSSSRMIRRRPVPVLVEDANTVEDQVQPEHASEIVSIAAEAERSFKTSWKLSESEWVRRVAQ
ncbi:hypothetical protein F66182_8247 [Fusarium sp. NRRL 66182]|nr:hypothetical protein F66182_8247 [Fusarium sp. NRRL 66182]